MSDVTKHLELFAESLKNAEASWDSAAETCSAENVAELTNALTDAFSAVMQGEPNADVLVALVHWLFFYTMHLSEETEMSLHTSMVMLHMGLQRSVAAHTVVNEAMAEKNYRGLDS
jgi:predicted HD phosphohydrolase